MPKENNYTVDTFILHSFIHKHSLRPISISSQLSAQWAEPPLGAEQRFELGPALQQASALPTEPHCTLSEPHCTLLSNTAPLKPHCTLLSHTAPWTEPHWKTIMHCLIIIINVYVCSFRSWLLACLSSTSCPWKDWQSVKWREQWTLQNGAPEVCWATLGPRLGHQVAAYLHCKKRFSCPKAGCH